MHERTARQAQQYTQPATKATANDGAVQRLPRLRHVLARLCRWLVVCLLPFVWPAAGAIAQQGISLGPSGSFGSIYVLEVPRDPAYPEPCEEFTQTALRDLFVAAPFGDVHITCGADEVLARYVVLVEGPRCVVTFEGEEIDRHPCVWLPQLKN